MDAGLPPPSLETERLRLQVLRPQAAPRVCTFFQANETFLQPWMPTFPAAFLTRRFQEAKLASDLNLVQGRRLLKFWMTLKTADAADEIVGFVAFNEIVHGVFQSCFAGYALAEKHCGKGLMHEGLKAATGFLFDEWKMHRVEANIMPRNIASIALAERLGFTKEGYSKDYLKINGKWEDHLRYALLNPAIL